MMTCASACLRLPPVLLAAAVSIFLTMTTVAREIEINSNGAWCWFQDERALIAGDYLVAGSITNDGAVEASALNLATGEVTISTLTTGFEADDHNVPGMLIREDGHLMAFYCRHGRDLNMHYRVSSRPGDPTSWDDEEIYTAGVPAPHNFTYANPFQLREEGGRTYNFWRAIDFNPTYSTSNDNGGTWSEARNIIFWKSGQRPYVKYASNGRDTIHFAFTEGHPHTVPNNIHHASYRAGSFHASDGAKIKKLADGPVTPDEATLVYDLTGPDSTGRGWIWDLALDADGHPVMVYSTRVSDEDLRYRYARWNADDGSWEEQQIAFAGHRLYRGEDDYAGGISIDPDDINTVYLSSNVNVEDGSPNGSGHYEIHQGKTSDRGKTWSWKSITSDSTEDNLRPIVPADHPGETFVLWMRGNYRTYRDYDTAIVLKTDAAIPAVKAAGN